jgi:hypothetical protein
LLAAEALEAIRTSYLVFQLINSDMLKFGVVVVGFLNQLLAEIWDTEECTCTQS